VYILYLLIGNIKVIITFYPAIKNMKKTVLLVLSGNFLYSIIFGQIPLPYRSENLKINGFSKKIVEIISLKDPIYLQNIGSIEVVDARPDTIAIGLASLNNKKPFFVVSEGAFAYDAQQFLNASIHFTKPDSFSVVMVIKKFWVTGGLDNEMEQKIRNTGIDTSTGKISSLLAKMEFYLKRGSDYFILYRFDSTITRNLSVSRDASALVEQALVSSISKLSEINSKFQSISESKRKFSWDEIEAHNQKRFDMPVLKDSVHIRGVYFSFEEFKNNNPGQRDFEIQRDKLADLIFIKQADGKLVPERDAWGYCDGRDLYIKSLENYFLLQRQGNAYYIYGAKELKHKRVIPLVGPVSNATFGGPTRTTNPVAPTSEGFTLKLRPYELDWDNGELN
jgi:hypothetical protein